MDNAPGGDLSAAPITEEATPDDSQFAESNVEVSDEPVGEVSDDGEPVTDGDFYQITVNGETVEVSLEEALAGYQRQADYTRKTQELSQQREQLQSLMALQQALEADPNGTLQALQQAYGVGTTQDSFEDLDPVEAQLAQVSQWMEQQQQAQREQEIRREANTARESHGLAGVTDEALVGFAVENQIGSLDVAARLMRAEQARNEQATATANRAPVVEAKRRAAFVEGGASRNSKAHAEPPASSIREAAAQAIREIRGVG